MSESAGAQLEARMLSGWSFTYGELRDEFPGIDEARTRLIDRTIQKLRRKGLIAYQREKGRGVVWRPSQDPHHG